MTKTKLHYCIFEITQPNKEQYEIKFVYDYGKEYTAANEMCQSMNNFKPKDKNVKFILRCLEQKELDIIKDFLKKNQNRDISKIYSPFLSAITIKLHTI